MDDPDNAGVSHMRHYHEAIMRAIAQCVGSEDKPLILKGGTALMLCYNLDRFSEDLDFDLEKPLNTRLNVTSICSNATGGHLPRDAKGAHLLQCRELKKTSTTHRCRAQFSIPQGSDPINLKIEISGRSADSEVVPDIREGIKVYPVDEIARQKLNAAGAFGDNPNPRIAARDLHDLSFIVSQWGDDLTPDTVSALESFFGDTVHLAEEYQEAFESDPLLSPAHLYSNLERAEKWLAHQQSQAPGNSLDF